MRISALICYRYAIISLMKKKTKMTLDRFAQIVAREFQNIRKEIEVIANTMATKDGLEALENRLSFQFDRRCELIEDRLRIIETALIRNKIIAR